MAKPLFLFAPGAGAPSSSDWMKAWAKRLGTIGKVVPFDYPYRLAGKKAPDRPPVLVAAHREALAKARKRHRGPVVLVGKSMGGRIGCHVSLEDRVDGLVCLGYPLKGMGKQGKIRDQVLKDLTVPILFVQGTKDQLCPLDLLKKTRRKMKAPNELHVIEAGNHSLTVTKTQLRADEETQDDVDERVLAQIETFVSNL